MEASDSFLSPRVKHIICESGCTAGCYSLESSSKYEQWLNCGLFNWDKIHEAFNVLGDAEDTFDYFERASSQMSPSFLMSEHLLHTLASAAFKDEYMEALRWTSSPDILFRCLHILQQNMDDTGTIHALLLSTSVLERSLGNVYLIRGSKCPSMLKDLLLTKELEDALGTVIIKFLRLIFGPATSLNLRNVVWHGFPTPKEIPKQYGYTMLLLAASIGDILKERGFHVDAKSRRDFVQFPQQQYLQPVIFPVDFNLIELASRCEYVHPSMLPIWHVATISLQEKRYGDVVSLLLPQIEHMLRCVFARANKCPDRILTAENTTLFTTFDEMLEKYLPDGSENELRMTLGDNLMDLICDLLTYPEGPRIRDRVSHGETDIDSFPGILAEYIVFLSASLCIQLLPSDSQLFKEKWVLDVRDAALKYESVFHPIAILKMQIRGLAASLDEWNQLDCQPEERKDELGTGNNENNKIPHVVETSTNLLRKYLPIQEDMVRCIEPDAVITDDVYPLLSKRITTIYRWKERSATTTQKHEGVPMSGSESELVGFLSRISTETMAISLQVLDTVRSRSQLWSNREMRSRQRNNYIKMLKSLPSISSGLRFVTLFVCCLFVTLDDPDLNSNQTRPQTTKVLRNVLQSVENLRTLTGPSENKWDVAVVKMSEMAQRIATL